MTYTMKDAWWLAQKVAEIDPRNGHFNDALFNVFLENQKKCHPTYNDTVRKIAEVRTQIENRGLLTHLVREIFGLNAREVDYQYALRDAEYDALVEMGRRASQQKNDMLDSVRGIQLGPEPDDNWPGPRGP